VSDWKNVRGGFIHTSTIKRGGGREKNESQSNCLATKRDTGKPARQWVGEIEKRREWGPAEENGNNKSNWA